MPPPPPSPTASLSRVIEMLNGIVPYLGASNNFAPSGNYLSQNLLNPDLDLSFFTPTPMPMPSAPLDFHTFLTTLMRKNNKNKINAPNQKALATSYPVPTTSAAQLKRGFPQFGEEPAATNPTPYNQPSSNLLSLPNILSTANLGDPQFGGGISEAEALEKASMPNNQRNFSPFAGAAANLGRPQLGERIAEAEALEKASMPNNQRNPVMPASPAPSPYLVEEGDTLWDIAGRLLGDNTRWTDLFTRNFPEIGKNPDFIKPGQKIFLPEESVSGGIEGNTQEMLAALDVLNKYFGR